MRKKRVLSEEHRRKISEALKGKKRMFSQEAIENIRKAAALRRGIPTGPCSEETKEKIRIATTGKKKSLSGSNPSFFKKGNVPINPFKKGNIPWNKGKKMPKSVVEKIAKKLRANGKGRGCWNYFQWKEACLKRDEYTCQHCSSNDNLHVHHIKDFNEYPELRFEAENGITLCRSCHAKLHGIKMINIKNGVKFKKGSIPWNKGKTLSEEHRKKLSDSHKGNVPWNKGLKVGPVA